MAFVLDTFTESSDIQLAPHVPVHGRSSACWLPIKGEIIVGAAMVTRQEPTSWEIARGLNAGILVIKKTEGGVVVESWTCALTCVDVTKCAIKFDANARRVFVCDGAREEQWRF